MKNKISIPSCTGHYENNSNGEEYNCDSIHGKDCTECLCNYFIYGGIYDPSTGKKITKAQEKYLLENKEA